MEAVVSDDDPHLWCYWSQVARATDTDTDAAYRLSLKRTPIDITEQIAPLFDAENAVIFTSATLQVDERFARIRQQLGITAGETEKNVIERVYPSPFPFAKNVEIHVFDDVLLDRPTPHASPDAKRTVLAGAGAACRVLR